MVNGASGFVVGFEPKDKVISILIKFDDDKTGREQRKMYHNDSMKYKEENGTPIRKERMEYFPSNKGKGARATVIQFPIDVSYATTAHKMQGIYLLINYFICITVLLLKLYPSL